MKQTAEVVICGAGIAGISAAWWLAVREGVRNVVLVDDHAPLTLTSDKSTEAYRNWWAGPDDAMVRYMNRNIDLLEELADDSDNRFLLNRRGYLYATANRERGDQMLRDAYEAERQGVGPVRVYRSLNECGDYQASAHLGYRNHPEGADVFVDPDAIRAHFPWLSPDICTLVHARRCGWFSGQQLGMMLLEEAKAAGARLVDGRATTVRTAGGAVRGVHVACADGTGIDIDTPHVVNAAGPHAKSVARMCGIDLPLFSEMHLKIAFEDTERVLDRNTGLVILDDAQTLEWSDEEREELAADDTTRWLTAPMPAGVHLRPEGYHGSNTVLMLWDYHSAHRYDEPQFPLEDDPFYPEVVMRGMVKLVPGLARYLDRLPHCYVDGGYYTKTVENRPLIGATSVEGFHLNVAYSGFGLMAAPASGELLAASMGLRSAPDYARAFRLDRYDDAAYANLLASWGSTGQL